MPILEIHHRSGNVERRELSKRVPLTIGRLGSNDIVIDCEGVAPVHCRISWNRRHFEAAAVTRSGIDWNGAVVQQAMLSPGDSVRIGDVDFVVQESADGEDDDRSDRVGAPVPHLARGSKAAPPEPPARPERLPDESMELKPITSEMLPVRSFHLSAQMSEDAQDKARAAGAAGAEPPTPAPSLSKRPGMSRLVDLPPEVPAPLPGPDWGEPETTSVGDESTRLPPADKHLAEIEARLQQKLKNPRTRPGEQQALRSPLVIGLGIGTLGLLLAAATIWFVLSREAAQKEFDAAKSLMDAGQYGPAVEAFEAFLRSRPRHALSGAAHVAISKAKVEQPLAGGVPAWDAGLEALGGFVGEYRDSEAFRDAESDVRKYAIQTADRIAYGAADSARVLRKRPLLAVSAEAAKQLELYSPSENPPKERLGEIAAVVRKAEAAILQQETFDGVIARMDEALAAKTSLAALPEYRRLLDRYPEAAEYRPLTDRLKKTLDLDRSQVIRDEARQEAARVDHPRPRATLPLTLSRRIRTRSDSPSIGATVFVSAEDCLYGVDAATGEPLWRRAIGLDAPFDPLPVSVGVPALLLYDARHRELILVQQRTGDLLWRLALEAPPHGAPLVFEGQALLATTGGTIEQIDVQSGTRMSRLRFPQGVVGPPVVSHSGERLYVPGHADLLYVLTRRPLGCEQVVWLGHGPGAIATPTLLARTLLLLAENDRVDSARLRAFDVSRENLPPRPLGDHRIEGLVHDPVAVRGKELVVPSSSERISAFTLAETGDQHSLAFVATFQVKGGRGGPMYVAIGPDDQFWMTSTALRRFTISRESILPDKQELAVGVASQPLQVIGNSLYVGRRFPFSRAVLFSEVDRLKMTAQWQTSIGARILGSTALTADGGTIWINGLGELFQVSAGKAARGGFELESPGQIAVPDGVSESLGVCRLADGRLAISCGGTEPRLWIVGFDGLPRESRLTHPLQADPILFGPGILAPLAGRLRLLNRNGDAAAAEDLPAPVADAASATWRSVTALDETQALTLDSNGRVSRIQFRTSPVAHLAEVTHWDAGNPVDQRLAFARGRVFVADTAGRVVVLDASSFEPLGETTLEKPARRPPWAVADRVLVETAAGKLVCLDPSQRLERRWELALEGGSLVGAPLTTESGRLVVALADGRVWLVDPKSGAISETLDLGQRLCFGPEAWGKRLVFGTLDGSLVLVDSSSEPMQEPGAP